MTAAPFKLEYELTGDELRAEFQRLLERAAIGKWTRRVGAVACLLALIIGWKDDSWSQRGFLGFFAIYLLLLDRWLTYWVGRSADRFRYEVEVDERGLRVTYPQHKSAPQRLWWSRLVDVEETDTGIELTFDRYFSNGVSIPNKAFASEEERQEFLDLAKRLMRYRMVRRTPAILQKACR